MINQIHQSNNQNDTNHQQNIRNDQSNKNDLKKLGIQTNCSVKVDPDWGH